MQMLDFDQEIVLENERVLLRPLRTRDFEELLPFSLHEPDLWKYSLLSADGTANLRHYIYGALQDKTAKTAYPFIVFDKQKMSYAGSTRFYDYNPRHETIQLGYTWYGREIQGTGLNKHCKYLMLNYAFLQLGLERVEFRADNNNARSIAAMKSIGCIVEGVLRNNCQSPTGRRDSIILSILKKEWFDGVRTALQQKIRAEAGRLL
ncbi:MAG: GNAT family N-acetyltransferase [Saprospiraceae bacterium]|nr:GNAT family N-acetyltransferase [Saprospiraceae bacterium]